MVKTICLFLCIGRDKGKKVSPFVNDYYSDFTVTIFEKINRFAIIFINGIIYHRTMF